MTKDQEARFKLVLAQMKETARIENARMRETLGAVRGEPWTDWQEIGRRGGRGKKRERIDAQ